MSNADKKPPPICQNCKKVLGGFTDEGYEYFCSLACNENYTGDVIEPWDFYSDDDDEF